MRDLLLIHAFPMGAGLFEAVEPPPGWRLWAPPLPGFDGSPLPPPGSTALDDYAHAVLAWLDARGVRTCVVGGVSMGGYVAAALWRLAPERCEGLLFIDTRAQADSESARAGRETMLVALHQRGVGAVADQMVPNLLGASTRRQHPAVEARLQDLIARQAAAAVEGAIVRIRDRADAAPTLGTVTVPTLVVVGEEDVITPVPEAERIAALVPGARLVRLPAVGHLPPMEAPEAFNRLLAGFLAEV